MKTFRTLFACLVIAALLLSACGTDEDYAQDTPPDVEAPLTDSNSADGANPKPPASAQEAAGKGDTWTIILYLDADDDVLEEDIVSDLNEMERVGSTDKVNIVAQLDRFDGSFDGDGDWTGTKRYHVTQDDDMSAIASEELEDLGEVDMGDPQSLIDFTTWAIENYPADRYALILSDHGAGWPGGWNDPAPNEGSELKLWEIASALETITSSTGIGQFDLLGFDACLMSQLEVYAAVYPYAHYMVASQETEPALGWAYTAWIGQLVENPGVDNAQVAASIVDSYIVGDQRILDDDVRTAVYGNVSAENVIDELGKGITLSAVSARDVPNLITAVNSLTIALANVDQKGVAKARSYAQTFESIFGHELPSPYIDLGSFAQVAAETSGDPSVTEAAGAVASAIQSALVAEKHGSDRAGATGFTIYFPTSKLYKNEGVTGDYLANSTNFVESSTWDDFLLFHYTGQAFEPSQPQTYIPPAPEDVTGPGAEVLELQPLEISTDTLSPDETVVLTSQVSGENIAFIYTFVGYVDEVSGAVLVADMDYLVTDDVREIGGVYYPDYGSGTLDLSYEWTPTLFALNDGQSSAFALFEPDDYGAADEAITYSVYGVYTPADGSEPNYAILLFAEGEMFQAFAFTGEDGGGAPWEITPQAGDQFTVLHTIQTEDENGEVLTSYQEGDTFTYGDQGFLWEEFPAPAGSYVVGFIVEDFDGNTYARFAPIAVVEP
ncbi:MAG: clostripain-related cysteine peptidase [Chloroflexota bacterium]